MIGFEVKAESGGLFSPAAINGPVDQATVKNLEKSAAYIRKVAANSLKPGRQKKLADLTREERITYRIQQSLFKAGKRKDKPKRPTVPSKPGEPPRLQRPSRYLKILLRYAADPSTKSVVVGSERIQRKGKAPAALEKGEPESNLRPRPYMVPALRKEVDKMAKRWENSITK